MNYDGYTKYNRNVAINYDDDRKEEEHWIAENAYIEILYKKSKITRLLEIPVGTGRFLKYYNNVEEITGVDISSEMLEVANKNNSNLNVKLMVGDAFNLEFENNYFQHVVCFRLLHLIPPEMRKALMLELSRVADEKIIIQVYMDKKFTLLERITNKLRSILKKFYSQSSFKPWSHIQSYGLSETEFKLLVDSASLYILSSKYLCTYSGSDVKIYELSRIKDENTNN